MSKYNTVLPKRVEGQCFEEASLASAMKPGTLVSVGMGASTDPNVLTATKQAVRGQNSYLVFEDELNAKAAITEIASGDRAVLVQLMTGNRVTPIVKSGVAIAVDDYLVPDVDGLVDIVVAGEMTTTGHLPQLFRAMEACAADATGDARRILVRVIR